MSGCPALFSDKDKAGSWNAPFWRAGLGARADVNEIEWVSWISDRWISDRGCDYNEHNDEGAERKDDPMDKLEDYKARTRVP